MPVTTSTTRLIFCEGKEDSYDYRLLNRLLTSGVSRIVPVGGKSGFNTYIEGYLSSFQQKPPFLAFRDRDFDLEPPDRPSLVSIPGAKPVWATYRACIESYLIDSSLIHDYWANMSVGPKWKFGSPPDSANIQAELEVSARQIAEYQAIRWALAALKPAGRWPTIGTTWLKRSGELPPSLAYSDCLDNARRLVEEYLSEASTVSIEKLDKAAEQYRQRFNAPEFYAAAQYLIWYHGKDLLQAICQRLGIKPLCEGYASWAVDHLDLNAHPDLLTLKELYEKL